MAVPELKSLSGHGVEVGDEVWPLADVLGAQEASPAPSMSVSSAAAPLVGVGELRIFRCAKVGSLPSTTQPAFKSSDPRPRALTRHTVRAENAEAASIWAKKINDAVRTGGPGIQAHEGGRPRRLLCIINPAAGRGVAKHTFDTEARPIFQAAGAMCDIRLTAAAGEATEIVHEINRADYDAVVVCGGDGSINEVLQGLVSREDAELACAELPLVHLGAGSGNAIAMNVTSECNEAYSVASCAYLAVKGSPRPLDVACAWDVNGVPHPFMLMMEWALVSDIDFESEWMRCCGGFRFTIQALIRILFLRQYTGYVEYLPMDSSNNGVPVPDPAEFFAMFKKASPAPGSTEASKPSRSVLLPLQPGHACPPGWQRVEGNFSVCVGCNAAWADSTTPLAPGARMGDGSLTFVSALNLNRFRILREFLRLDEGQHLESGEAQAVRVRALRLVPADNSPSAIGVDGEKLMPATVRFKFVECVCYPGVLRVMMV